MSSKYGYRTKVWSEEPEADNPFAAHSALCYGYDVYGDILTKASWFEYLYLLFRGEKPNADQAQLLEKLAIALANPGPREASVRAAMNGGVGGCPHAASLMASLAVGAGQYGGGHEVYILMQLWRECGTDVEQWRARLPSPVSDTREDIWRPMEHAPGFDPNGESCPKPVRQVLEALAEIPCAITVRWLAQHRQELEAIADAPLALSGVAAAALHDLAMNEHAAVMLYLMLRLPGAAAHAIEQRDLGWKMFPFYGDHIKLTDDPGPFELPNAEELGL
ncbi:citryl-CoA lyase [Hahella sp. CR1]|uniref:citryl-CoA lyase n=1 Tax=unclassified Hahella TaxID=2624107 RepID=UPI002442FD72|nr:citryl-CoA lyase [Hahella sp. CR1]MDG9671859.1 citryl-CoA lyase [Hahella sp. CR1]